jgi:integrase
MARINRRHVEGCPGEACSCPWRLDYRPLGLAGPRKRIEFPTKKAAEKYLSATTHKVTRGEYIPPERVPPFASVASEWLTSKGDRHPSTVQAWRVHLRHLSPLDTVRLDRIEVAAVERLRDRLRRQLSARTVSAIMTTAAAVFKFAMRRGYVTTNPAALAERPRRAVMELSGDDDAQGSSGLRPVRPDEVLSANEIARLLDAAEPGLYRTLFTTVAATGLRPEEAYALRWGDLELTQGQARLFVRRALSWSRGIAEEGAVRPKFFEPKTRSSYRDLPLPHELVAILQSWQLKCPASAYDLVFCRADGQPLHRSNVLRQGLYPALRRAQLRSANLKTLRHSYASGLIAAGGPITEVQHRLGHSNPSVTLKVYSHWFKDADTGAADRFAAGFLKSSSAHSVPTLGEFEMISDDQEPSKMLRK